jgi:uncharacterized HAD superfamily protein
MSTCKIAFDIDGIVLDTPRAMWNVITNHLGIPWSMDAWTTYEVDKMFGVPKDSLRPVYEEVLYRHDLPMLPGAAEGLRRVAERQELIFITARRPQFIEPAKISIATGLSDVEFRVIGSSNSTEDRDDNKLEIMKEMSINIFVEDNPNYWDLYTEAGIEIWTLDWPWTRGPARNRQGTPRDLRLMSDWGLLSHILLDQHGGMI